MENALIIFIKNPEIGKVKTRLARTVGDIEALSIYLRLLEITREMALILRGVKVYVFYSDFVEQDDEWANDYFEKYVQNGSDLGLRMSNAFSFVIEQHSKVCIIGSDCPTLSADIVEQAFWELQINDYVLGPSTDGGYYLLGLRKNEKHASNTQNHYQFLFENMEWSTSKVLLQSLDRIKEKGKTVFLLPALTDIDEETDWINFQKNSQPN